MGSASSGSVDNEIKSAGSAIPPRVAVEVGRKWPGGCAPFCYDDNLDI